MLIDFNYEYVCVDKYKYDTITAQNYLLLNNLQLEFESELYRLNVECKVTSLSRKKAK